MIRQQAFDLSEERVRRNPVVVQALQDGAGSVGIRIQHDSIHTIKPIPATRALQESGAGVDWRVQAGFTNTHAQPLRQDIEAGMSSAIRLLTQPVQQALGIAVQDLILQLYFGSHPFIYDILCVIKGV